MGMSQSVSLPSGMLESLGKYKEALKETKREMRELEREARRMQKGGGTVSREVAGRLETARGSRARLEDAIVAQKVAKRSGYGAAVAGGFIGGSAISQFKAFPKASGGMSLFAALKASSWVTKGKPVISKRMPDFQKDDYVSLSDYIARSNKRIFQRQAIRAMKKVGLPAKEIYRGISKTGGAIASSIGPLAMAAGVGTGIGLGIRETIGGAGTTKKYMAEAKSAIGTDAFYKSLSDQISSSGESSNTFITLKAISDKAGKIARRKYLRSTLTGSISMLGALYRQNTWARNTFESFEPLESIAFGDKVIENTMKREMKSKKYGRRYDEHISFDTLKDTRGSEYTARISEEIGWGTKWWNGVLRVFKFGPDPIVEITNGDIEIARSLYRQPSYAWKNIPGLREVERAQEAVKQKWLTERDGTYNKEYVDVQAIRDSLVDVRKARERMDEHERSNAITAFNNDRLTRGLTWSQ